MFFGQFKEASDRKELRRLAAQGARLSLVLYTGVFLMIGLPALWLWSIYYLVSGVRRKTLDPPAAILIGFLFLNIAYVTADRELPVQLRKQSLSFSAGRVLRGAARGGVEHD